MRISSALTIASGASTNATTLSSIDMSRNDSLGGNSSYSELEMMKVGPQRSESLIQPDAAVDDFIHNDDARKLYRSLSVSTRVSAYFTDEDVDVA